MDRVLNFPFSRSGTGVCQTVVCSASSVQTAQFSANRLASAIGGSRYAFLDASGHSTSSQIVLRIKLLEKLEYETPKTEKDVDR